MEKQFPLIVLLYYSGEDNSDGHNSELNCLDGILIGIQLGLGRLKLIIINALWGFVLFFTYRERERGRFESDSAQFQ